MKYQDWDFQVILIIIKEKCIDFELSINKEYIFLSAPPPGHEDAPDLLNLLDTIKVDSEDIEVIKREAKDMFTDVKDKKEVYQRIDGKF